MHDRGHRKRHLYTYIEYAKTNEDQSSFQESIKNISRGLNTTSRSPSPEKNRGFTRSLTFDKSPKKNEKGVTQSNLIDSFEDDLDEREDTFGNEVDPNASSLKLGRTNSILKDSGSLNAIKMKKSVAFTEEN